MSGAAKRTAPAGRRVQVSRKHAPASRKKKKAKPAPVRKVGMNPRRAFSALGQENGMGVYLLVAEKMDGRWDAAESSHILANSLGAGARCGRLSTTLCRAMAAVGHPQRGRILCKLLEGPATYQALQHLTKLKAGPLYHHVGELRMAGLMLPRERDLYELTRAGRNVILATLALGSLVRDGRRRP